MSDEKYAALADALDRLPNGFPRTESGIEILILRKLLTTDDAALGSLLSKDAETAEAIAPRAGLPVPEARKRLLGLVRKGLAWTWKDERGMVFRLAPFVVGFYEAQSDNLDHELAHLLEDYFAHGGARGIMGPLPSLHRVVPAHGTVKSESILPYDRVKELLAEATAFTVTDCMCRKETELARGRACSKPLHNCLSFSAGARPARPGDISREEALAILDASEEAALVHTVSNVIKGVSYVCNCCGCCCGILRGITEYGLEHSVAVANYRASIDAGACTGCEICVERCQVKAISMRDGVAVVDALRCIGCGLCVSGCTAEAATLSPRPAAEVVHPPADFAAWERARLANRART